MTGVVKIVNNVVDGGPAYNVPGHLSFGQFYIDQLKKISEDDTAEYLVNGETGQKTTYKQMLQEVVNIAVGLKRQGLKPGGILAICSENRYEYIATAAAAICCGATVTTVNLQYSKDEMNHIFNISRPNIIVGSELGLKLNIKTLKTVSSIKKIIQFDGKPVANGIIPFESILVPTNVSEFEPEDVQGCSDVALILYSSGTTGLPKGVMITHMNMLYGAANFIKEDESPVVDENKVLLTLVPWYHAYGLLSTMHYGTVGKKLVYFAGFHPQKYLNAIQEHKVNMLLVVPPIVVFLAKSPLVEKYDLSSVRSIWSGAAPLSAETIAATLKRFPACNGVFQAYGMTETSLVATKDTEDAERKPGSGGFPMRGIKAKVVDIETRKKLGVGEKGEICIKGPILMKGYAGNVAATRAIIDNEGYLKTGDIGYYDKDGHFFIVDRLKELIKYKGSQVPPAEVESVLLQHSAVGECGVVGAPDEKAGELATAFVVLKPGVTATEKELLDFTASQLSPEKRLYGGILFVNEIPKNPSGKILRRELKKMLTEKRRSKL